MKKEMKGLLEKADRYLRSAELLLKDCVSIPMHRDATVPCFTQYEAYITYERFEDVLSYCSVDFFYRKTLCEMLCLRKTKKMGEKTLKRKGV